MTCSPLNNSDMNVARPYTLSIYTLDLPSKLRAAL